MGREEAGNPVRSLVDWPGLLGSLLRSPYKGATHSAEEEPAGPKGGGKKSGVNTSGIGTPAWSRGSHFKNVFENVTLTHRRIVITLT